jgi:aminoglycoside phosphotransferase (APT) family kinase protein
MSAGIFLIEVDEGAPDTQIVARFPSPLMRTLFADAPGHEFRVLKLVWETGLPVPRPLWCNRDLLLLEFLPGAATANPSVPEHFLREMATMLARIHSVRLNGAEFLPATKRIFVPPQREPNRDLREQEVIAACTRLVPSERGPEILRHGDFWPGNILWLGQTLSGIIDWENAILGPALADLAITRLDVLWILGKPAMDVFTRQYLAQHPLDLAHLPYWDLRAALRPMGNLHEWAPTYAALDRTDITLATMREALLQFVDDALNRA